MRIICLCFGISLIILLFWSSCSVLADANQVQQVYAGSASEPGLSSTDPYLIRIGVLANRGDEIALQEWGPVAAYLTKNLPPFRFIIVPFDFEEIIPAVKNQEVSFVTANPSIYTYFEYYGLAQRIATLQVPGDPEPQPVFGGVIFTRADRDDIQTIHDLRGKRFAAVNPTSLGGWHAGLFEIMDAGIDPYKDFASLSFLETHDNTVFAVINREADAGTARSTQLERMQREGRINLSDIRVINSRQNESPDYPYLLSTRLYPEWPMATTLGTDRDLCKKVSVALLMMDEADPAALAVHGAGWAIPQDHSSVHELLRRLQIAPYDQYGKPTIQEVISQYWQTIIATILVLITLSLLLVYTWQTKKELSRALQQVKESERVLTTLISNLPGFVYRCANDPDWTMEYVSEGCRELTGYAPDDFIGNRTLAYNDIVSPDHQIKLWEKWQEVLTRQEYFEDEYQIITRSGEIRYVWERGQGIFSEKGELLFLEGFISDVTDRKKMDEALRESYQKIRLLTSLTRHDILNHLTSMQLSHSLALDEEDEDEWRQYIIRAEQAGSRIEAAIGFTREYENFGIAGSGWQSVFHSIGSATGDIIPSGVMVENEVQENLEVYADPIIRKVFTTFLENAIRHGVSVSKIRFFSEELDGELSLVCEDDGVGIPDSDKTLIFERGYGANTGIGLFLAKEILSITGLSLSENGTYGEGARFVIRVPAGKWRMKGD